MAKQNAKLADDVCKLVEDKKISLNDAENLLRYMTNVPCVIDGETEPAGGAARYLRNPRVQWTSV